MPKVVLYNQSGSQVGELESSNNVFGVEDNQQAIYDTVVAERAAMRQGTQKAKTRSEVSGGGRKPWRQKGTGRARQGSTRSPQWTHGGIALGPKPRSYRFSVNKKLRRLAMKSAMSVKVQDNNMIVLDAITMDEYKTKTIVNMLKAVEAEGKKALIVMPENNSFVVKSAANIPGVKTALVNTINVYDILNCDKFIVVKDAVAKIEEVYA